MIFDNFSSSSQTISCLFSKIIFFALFSASSSKESSFIILHFLVLKGQSFKFIKPFPA